MVNTAKGWRAQQARWNQSVGQRIVEALQALRGQTQVVYRGGSHVVVCLGNQHVKLCEDGTWRYSERCSEWVGGCPAAKQEASC